MGSQDPRAPSVVTAAQAPPVPLDHVASLESWASLEAVALRETEGSRESVEMRAQPVAWDTLARTETPAPPALLDQLELPARRESRERQVAPGSRVCPAWLELMERLGRQERREPPVSLEELGRLDLGASVDLRDRGERVGLLAPPVPPEPLDPPETMEPRDPRARPDLLEAPEPLVCRACPVRADRTECRDPRETAASLGQVALMAAQGKTAPGV